MREMLANRFHVGGGERAAFETAAQENFVPEGGLVWNGDVASLGDPDDRISILLAQVLFRPRFGETWPFDPPEDLDDEDA